MTEETSRIEPHRQAGAGHMVFSLTNGKLPEMEDRGCQHRSRMSLADAIHQVVQIADAAGGDDRHRNTVRDLPRERQVKTLPRAVAVHRSQKDLARAERDHFLGIFDGVDPRGIAAAMGEDFPAIRAAAALHALGVDRHHDALLTELYRRLLDEFAASHRS